MEEVTTNTIRCDDNSIHSLYGNDQDKTSYPPIKLAEGSKEQRTEAEPEHVKRNTKDGNRL